MQSIKIVGISGTGKTTLIRAASAGRPGIAHVGFSEYVRRFGKHADSAWRAAFARRDGLILVDDHLEYGDADLAATYARERTAGIVLIECSVDTLLRRRSMDRSRIRDASREVALHEQRRSARRAVALAERLRVPLVRLHDASLQESCSALEALITTARGN